MGLRVTCASLWRTGCILWPSFVQAVIDIPLFYFYVQIIIKLARLTLIGSLGTILTGYAWLFFEPQNSVAIAFKFFGWITFLLAVGYLSTPTNSKYGKISFGFVVIMIIGIVMKVLHLAWANELILVGIAGVIFTYVIMWLRESKKDWQNFRVAFCDRPIQSEGQPHWGYFRPCWCCVQALRNGSTNKQAQHHPTNHFFILSFILFISSIHLACLMNLPAYLPRNTNKGGGISSSSRGGDSARKERLLAGRRD